MWKEHTPEPFSSMPDGYSFLVKHSLLWRLSYECLQPRLLHLPYLSFFHLFMAKGLNEAMDKYRPDLVVRCCWCWRWLRWWWRWRMVALVLLALVVAARVSASG